MARSQAFGSSPASTAISTARTSNSSSQSSGAPIISSSRWLSRRQRGRFEAARCRSTSASKG